MTMTFKQLVDSTGEFATWRRNYPNAEFISEIGIIPFRGIKSILFTIQCRSYTTQVQNAVRRKKGKKVKSVPVYTDYIQFMDVKFGDRLEDSNWAVIEYKNQKYYFRKPSLFKNPVKVRCNCFTGDTRIILGNGETATLKELESKTNIEVISFNTTSNKFEIAKLLCCEKKSDNEELLKITLDNGEQIKTTKDHLFLTKQGDWIEAQNLEVGQSLMALYGYKDNDKLFQKANKKWQRIRKYNNKEDYYVYVYLDPTKPGNYKYSDVEFSYQPFYVGKGRAGRINEHLIKCLNDNSNNYFYNYLKKLLNNDYQPIIIKTHYGLNEQAAFDIEKRLIKEIGRLNIKTGYLTNLTNGGEGSSGLPCTEENILRMQNNNPMFNKKTIKKVVNTKEIRGYYLEQKNKFIHQNPMFYKDIVEKMINTSREKGLYSSDNMSHIASYRTEETFNQMIKQREKNNPDCYKNFIEAGHNAIQESIKNGTFHAFTQEFKVTISKKSKDNWKNPEYREKLLKSLQEVHKSEETKKKHKLAGLKNWENPEYRQKVNKQFLNPIRNEKIQKTKILKGMIEVIKTYGKFIPEYYVANHIRMRLEKVKEKGWYNDLLNQAEKEAFYNHKILKIEQIQNDEVYCPTIEGLGNFVIYAPDKNSKLFSGVVVKNCPDFQFRFSWEDRAQQALYGGPPKVYIRKTPPPPLGRPEVNPEFIPGICKHLYDFAKQLEPFVNIIE